MIYICALIGSFPQTMTRGHGYDGVIDKLMLESMGDYTKERDHARALSRVVDEVHQFFELPCLLLPGHTGDHHRIVLLMASKTRRMG